MSALLVSPVLRALLCGLLAAVLIRWPRRQLLLGAAALAVFVGLSAPVDRAVRQGETRAYTWAHYRLGAVFFGELGYTGLYGAMLGADTAGHWASDGPAPIQEVRDQRTYRLGPRSTVQAMAPARQERLEAEVAAFQPMLSAASWRSFFRDKGYNATPAWQASTGAVVAAAPLSSMRWVGLIDLGLLAGALGCAARAFGVVPALLASAWIALSPGADGNLVGGPLQLDWIALFVLGLCGLRLGRPGTAGLLIGAAAMARVFPALLLVAPLIAAVVRWRDVARVPRAWIRFAGGALAALIALGVLGASTARGPAAWLEFAETITTHAGQQHLGDKRVGLASLVAWVPQGGRFDAQAREDRVARWPARREAHRALASLLVALWGAAVLLGASHRGAGARRPEDDPPDLIPLLLLGLPLVFVAAPLSRYYVLIPGLLLLLAAPGARTVLGAALFGLCGAMWLAEAAGLPDATVYAIGNAGWLLVWLAMTWTFARTGRLEIGAITSS